MLSSWVLAGVFLFTIRPGWFVWSVSVWFAGSSSQQHLLPDKPRIRFLLFYPQIFGSFQSKFTLHWAGSTLFNLISVNGVKLFIMKRTLTIQGSSLNRDRWDQADGIRRRFSVGELVCLKSLDNSGTVLQTLNSTQLMLDISFLKGRKRAERKRA